MASSGSFSGSIVSGHYQLRVDWSQAQNVSANKSTITAKIYLVNDWSLSINSRTSSITINGTSQNYSSSSISTTGTHLLATVTQEVAHDSDGSKSIAMSCVFNIQATISGTYYGSISCSANVTLDTIPRASSVSMPTATMGSEVTISINPAVDQFTHTLAYSFGSASGTITTKTSLLAVKWTPALTLANQIPNTTSGTGTLTCYTYSGSTLIGTKSITITLKVPTSVVPTIGSFTATRVDGTVPSSWGIYVQNKSAVTLTISADHLQRRRCIRFDHQGVQHHRRQLLRLQLDSHDRCAGFLRHLHVHGQGDGFTRPHGNEDREHQRGGVQSTGYHRARIVPQQQQRNGSGCRNIYPRSRDLHVCILQQQEHSHPGNVLQTLHSNDLDQRQ